MYGESYLFLAAVLVTALAALLDWRTGRIPNWLTLGSLAAAPIAHGAFGLAGGGWSAAGEALGLSLLGVIVCSIVPLVLYRGNAIGGGDVKLLAALGAVLRPMVGMEAQLYAYIVAALLAPVRLAWEGKLLRTLGNTVMLVRNLFVPKAKRKEIPREMLTMQRFGPAIFIATLATVFMHWKG
jgi:prepilin peptidase CpaA